ncbi:hypothetical protein AKJ16_DCAP09323 [Drosera capensis]
MKCSYGFNKKPENSRQRENGEASAMNAVADDGGAPAPFSLRRQATGFCKTSHPDHDKQCPIRNMQPKVQFLPLASPSESNTGVVSCNGGTGLYIVGPLYKVIAVAPATQLIVPAILAMPSFLSSLTSSILFKDECGGISCEPMSINIADQWWRDLALWGVSYEILLYAKILSLRKIKVVGIHIDTMCSRRRRYAEQDPACMNRSENNLTKNRVLVSLMISTQDEDVKGSNPDPQ